MPDDTDMIETHETRCRLCGAITSRRPFTFIYGNYSWRSEIMRATPKTIWREYEANGYSIREAVEMEMSYAG